MEAEQGLISFTNPKPIHAYTYLYSHLYFSRQIGDGNAYAGVGFSVFHPSRQDTTYTVHAIVIMSWLKEMLVMRKLLVDGVVDFKGLFGSGTP